MLKILEFKMQYIQVKFSMEKDMEKEHKFGMMGQNMKEIGKMINLMDMVHFTTLMGMFTKDFGKITEQMVKEYI